MRYRCLDIRLLSPVCIAQRPTAVGQPVETIEYLTGTVLRGGIAAAWLHGRRYEDLSSDKQQLFQRLFLGNELSFLNGWPYHATAQQTWVIPRTAWTTRRGKGGWLDDGNDGVVDVLLPLLHGKSPDSLRTDRDPHSPDTLDPLGRPFARWDDETWSDIIVRRRLITRTALTPIDAPELLSGRGVAYQGRLYSFSAIETGQRFTAWIAGPDDLVQKLEHSVVQDGQVMTLGQGRSRGMGRVRMIPVEDAPPWGQGTRDDMERAVREFSRHAGAPAETLFLPLTLLSDVILRDRYLLPCSRGDPVETLPHYWQGAPPSMRLHYAYQSTRWIGGWDMLRNLPSEPQLAVQQGSVWVYRVAERDMSAAVQWWLDREHNGLGERRNEGFGRVVLLHPLHQEKAGHLW
jgi:CRISPR-associated Csx10 family RAMP protein